MDTANDLLRAARPQNSNVVCDHNKEVNAMNESA